MNYNESLRLVSNYVVAFYTKQMDARLLYHNHSHTWELTETVTKMASKLGLGDRDRFIVLAAAWFYDTGYLVPGPLGYEDKSAGQAAVFLKSIAVDDVDINEVKNCITATSIPQNPKTLPEKILCDALSYYMGTNDYAEKNRLLRSETEALTNEDISGTEWRHRSIAALETHNYFTDYCQSRLNNTKIENLNRLRRKQEEKAKDDLLKKEKAARRAAENAGSEEPGSERAIVVNISKPDGQQELSLKKQKEKKKEKAARGVDAMFRVSSTNHQRLSSQADNKAHIMISVNSIIISVVLGLIVRKLDSSSQYLLIPTILLLVVNVITIIFSVLATRPRIPLGYFTKEQIAKKDVDLTFFGNFYNMDFNEYEAGMDAMMHDAEFLHGSMIRNLYGQAKVLGRKFKLLHVSYNVFMFGIVVSVLAYVFVLIFNT
jgi:predicted metal-dependent HD superfamily phosphohydrolase